MRAKAPAAPWVRQGKAGLIHRKIGEDRIWRSLRAERASGAPRPALFLDRDGTVIEEVPYLSRPEEVRPIPEAVETIVRANALGIPVVVVSNQSGIARGLFDWSAFAAVEAAIDSAIAQAGGQIDAVYACPHAPPGPGKPSPSDRKPDPGMLLRAAKDLNLDPKSSWVAGDRASDLEAGRSAGLCRGWLAPTGYGRREANAARALANDSFEVVVGKPLDALATELETLRSG